MILSLISMFRGSLNYLKYLIFKGKDNEYPNIIRKQALAANADAKKEGVVVPMTLEDYCIKPKRKEPTEPTLESNFFDDVFHTDNTRNSAVLIDGNGNMHMTPFKLTQQAIDTLRLWNKEGLTTMLF